MKIEAKKIRIDFNNSAEDYWEATSESGISFDDAMHMIARAWEEHDKPKEPYIGDKATAMFVRAWAKHWGIERVKARTSIHHDVELIGWVDDPMGKEIDIQAAFVSGEIEDGHEYAIEELCGEEE